MTQVEEALMVLRLYAKSHQAPIHHEREKIGKDRMVAVVSFNPIVGHVERYVLDDEIWRSLCTDFVNRTTLIVSQRRCVSSKYAYLKCRLVYIDQDFASMEGIVNPSYQGMQHPYQKNMYPLPQVRTLIEAMTKKYSFVDKESGSK